MRKLLLFTLLILTAGGAGVSSEKFKLELYADGQKTGGVKLSLPAGEMRTSTQNDKFNFGLLFSTAKLFKKVSIDIKYGNLSAGGSLSKLNSPELSSGSSPFSNGLISVSALTANLPGYQSFSKPESTFLQIKTNQLTRHPFSMNLNLWLSPENSSPVFSAILSDKFFKNRLLLNSSFTAGNFYYDENKASSWFLETPFYTADSHFCSIVQFSAELRNKTQNRSFYTGGLAAVYETPFGPMSAAYRLDLKLSLKKADFYLSGFVNQYEDILTSSEKKLSPGLQFKGGLLTKNTILQKNQKLSFLKIAINAYSKINLMETEHPLKINAGFQLNSEKSALSFSASANTSFLSTSAELPPEDFCFNSLSAQIKKSWYFTSITPALSAAAEKKFPGASDSENDAMKYKLQFNLTNNSVHKISGNLTYSFSEKDWKITGKKISAGLSCRMNWKHLTVTGKVSGSLKL